MEGLLSTGPTPSSLIKRYALKLKSNTGNYRIFLRFIEHLDTRTYLNNNEKHNLKETYVQKYLDRNVVECLVASRCVV